MAERGTIPAEFTEDELAGVSERAAAAIAELNAERASHYRDFAARGQRVVVRLTGEDERLEVDRFDPMAVEILDRGEALQAHALTAEHPRGRIGLENPSFKRRSLEGVIALTVPAGEHPFLDGFRRVSVSGFGGEATVVRDGESVRVDAEGLTLAFDGASVDSNKEEIVISVHPVANGN